MNELTLVLLLASCYVVTWAEPSMPWRVTKACNSKVLVTIREKRIRSSLKSPERVGAIDLIGDSGGPLRAGSIRQRATRGRKVTPGVISARYQPTFLEALTSFACPPVHKPHMLCMWYNREARAERPGSKRAERSGGGSR